MARPVWSGSIAFGLVNIPIKLYTATRDRDVHFNMLCAEDKSRVKQKLVCSSTGDEVSREEVAPKSAKTMEIQDFCDVAELDPIYFERPYYAMPAETSVKAYRLLVQALENTNMVGIARVVMHNKEHLTAIRAKDHFVNVAMMRFPDEVVPVNEIAGDVGPAKVDPRELKAAEELVRALAGSFQPEKYENEYRQKLLDLIERKRLGEEVSVAPEPSEAPRTIDLMSALKASLAEAKKAKSSPATPRKGRPHEQQEDAGGGRRARACVVEFGQGVVRPGRLPQG